jgi:hypothetical protein
MEEIRAAVARYRVALMESLEFAEVVSFLATLEKSIIAPKLAKILDGPALPSEESSSSNVARNVQFELSFASMLSRAGFSPELGEHPDVSIIVDGRVFLFQCKRLFTPAKLQTRIREAGRQLRDDRKNHPATARGIVVMSLSRVLNPAAMAFRAPDSKTAHDALGTWLATAVKTVEADYRELFQRDIAVGAFFHGVTDFENVETQRFDRGSFFQAEVCVPPFSSFITPNDLIRPQQTRGRPP